MATLKRRKNNVMRERGREIEKGSWSEVTTLLPLVNLPNAYIMARQTFLFLFLFSPLFSFFTFLSNNTKRKQE